MSHDLTSLLMCWFDTGTLDFLIIDKKEIFDTTFIDIIFEKRNYFEDFLKCVNDRYLRGLKTTTISLTLNLLLKTYLILI